VNAAALTAFYAGKGLRVEIEAGSAGLVVYAPTRVDALRVSLELAGSARARDPRAKASPPLRDEDEPAETAWWSVVEFDWRRF
jgi:hypothetical protein